MKEVLAWRPDSNPPPEGERVLVYRDGFGVDLAAYEHGSWYVADSLGEIELHDVLWWAKVRGPQ